MATVRSHSRDLGSTLTLVVHVVASLDKALYDVYLCLVKSKKQPENSEINNSKRVRIRPKYRATVAF